MNKSNLRNKKKNYLYEPAHIGINKKEL